MNKELELRRKWTFRAHGEQKVFVKKSYESDIHVVMKALLWAIYLPDYPDLSVEITVGNRYKPDLVQLDHAGKPEFWGEAGQVRLKKMRTLLNRFRSTHLAFAKWNMNLRPFEKFLRKEINSVPRSAPVDLILFPADSGERFIRPDGEIRMESNDIERIRF